MKFRTSLLFQRLFPFVRFLIPPEARKTPSEITMAENLIAGTMLALVVIPAFSLFYLFLDDATSARACLLAMPGILVAPLLLRLSGKTALAREILTGTIYCLLIFIIYRVGGAASPAVIWLAVCPLLATAVGGLFCGLKWTAIVLLSVFGIYLADLRDLFPAPVVKDMRLLGLVATVSFVMLVAVFLLIYERITSSAISKLDQALSIIHSLAIRDELTGVFNRRELLRVAEQEKNRADRQGIPFCLAIIDLDHFKQINDSRGHTTGDEVLKQVAARIQEEVRKNDCFGRYGGEEFLLIMSATDIDAAAALVNRILDAVEGAAIPEMEGDAVTVSIGVAQYHHNEVIEQTLARADKALYRAKHDGRNRVVAVRSDFSNAA